MVWATRSSTFDVIDRHLAVNLRQFSVGNSHPIFGCNFCFPPDAADSWRCVRSTCVFTFGLRCWRRCISQAQPQANQGQMSMVSRLASARYRLSLFNRCAAKGCHDFGIRLHGFVEKLAVFRTWIYYRFSVRNLLPFFGRESSILSCCRKAVGVSLLKNGRRILSENELSWTQYGGKLAP